jgi:hypothetical protein
MQCRVREIMLFDWNENGLETHDDIQVEHRCARTAHASERLRTYSPFHTRPLGAIGHPRALHRSSQ